MKTVYTPFSFKWNLVFVPFLGDFFSIGNIERVISLAKFVFVPFLGDFFSIGENNGRKAD